MNTTTPAPLATIRREIRARWERVPFARRYRIERAAAEVRTRILGDPTHRAAAADPQTFEAPEVKGSYYRHEWDEYDAATVARIMRATARAPRETRDAARRLVREMARGVEARRDERYHASYTRNAAADVVSEVCDRDDTDYRDAIRTHADDADHAASAYEIADDLDYSGGIAERVDSACPVYTATILRVFALDPDVDTESELGDEERDAVKLASYCIYEAIDAAAREGIREQIERDLDDEETTDAEADEAAALLGYPSAGDALDLYAEHAAGF